VCGVGAVGSVVRARRCVFPRAVRVNIKHGDGRVIIIIIIRRKRARVRNVVGGVGVP